MPWAVVVSSDIGYKRLTRGSFTLLYREDIRYSLKVRLRWFGAVLQYLCKFAVFILSFNILITSIHH